MADAYIVVLDAAADSVRVMLFDSEARRVEGYGAQLPQRVDAAADCLDEMHRLVCAAGLRVGAVMGRAESEVTAEDRSFWPAFKDAAWFPALPDGAGAMLGSGCVGPEFTWLTLGEKSMLGTVVESPVEVEGLACVAIDDRRWMLSGVVAESGAAYVDLKRAAKGSVERYLESAADGDPVVVGIESAGRGFRRVYELLGRRPPQLGAPPHIIACGAVLLKAPSLAQRIADAMGASLTLSTELEPGHRGSALWALERIGAIGDLRVLPASMGAVFYATE
jgi:hypothetical protein